MLFVLCNLGSDQDFMIVLIQLVNSINIINHKLRAECCAGNSRHEFHRKELRFLKEQDLLILFLGFLVTMRSLAACHLPA